MREWADVLPSNIAKEQERWVFRHRLYAAKQSGTTYVALGKAIGKSYVRTRQLCCKAEREIKAGRRSPIEVYFKQFDLVQLEVEDSESAYDRHGDMRPKEFRARLLDAKKRKELQERADELERMGVRGCSYWHTHSTEEWEILLINARSHWEFDREQERVRQQQVKARALTDPASVARYFEGWARNQPDCVIVQLEHDVPTGDGRKARVVFR